VFDCFLLSLAADYASTTTADIHSFQEFRLSIHALELNIRVTARSRIIFLVIISFLENAFSFDLQPLNLTLQLRYFFF